MAEASGDSYTVDQVERLLGLREGLSYASGPRHVTVLDLISWAADPGGDRTWLQIAYEIDPAHAWKFRRGPLAPHSDWACVLWDFERAMSKLPLFEQVVVALSVMGFSSQEIAQVIDPDGIIELEADKPARQREQDLRIVGRRKKRIARLVEGRPKRDSEGSEIRNEDGDLVYTGGVAVRLARLMNGGPR